MPKQTRDSHIEKNYPKLVYTIIYLQGQIINERSKKEETALRKDIKKIH